MPVELELLAPARNKDIGIAAIDCGADAVYIAGPAFGAREAASNSFSDIAELTAYAHRFGAKVFLTLNTIIYDNELEDARKCILNAVDAGCDALIIQDLGILKMQIPQIELHASTQCNIRTPEQARFLESLGFRRLVLARELSLAQIRAIAGTVKCGIECFVHGALCVSYSGQCYLSQYLTGRSANRGCCIQACRSRYDVIDSSGKTIVRDKAVLSLKDLSLEDRLQEMAQAGATSFKIEGRLKNMSYVKNIVREYSNALDKIIAGSGGKYARSSYGSPSGGFRPDPSVTFNRGYTKYFIDGTRGKWSSSDYAKSIGEYVGKAGRKISANSFEIHQASGLSVPVSNGDGLCYISNSGEVTGMRADTVINSVVTCSQKTDIRTGTEIYRNFNRTFEKYLENNTPVRLVRAEISISRTGSGEYRATAVAENGKAATLDFPAETAQDRTKALENLKNSFSKRSGIFSFTLTGIPEETLPFLPSSGLNAIRRELAGRLEAAEEESTNRHTENVCHEHIVPPAQRNQLNCANRLSRALYTGMGIDPAPAYELSPDKNTELMRCKFCLRYEHGKCPRTNPKEKAEPLYLINNGKRLKAVFDCAKCEMVILPA